VRRLEDAEDARDLRTAAEAESRIYLPIDAVKRMIAGEHPVRIWREQRGLTLADLAAKAAMQVGYLSEIETGKKPGSVRAYRALAGALGLSVDDLPPSGILLISDANSAVPFVSIQRQGSSNPSPCSRRTATLAPRDIAAAEPQWAAAGSLPLSRAWRAHALQPVSPAGVELVEVQRAT
jgi:transcriptional regulator with XRE-family HTH domain